MLEIISVCNSIESHKEVTIGRMGRDYGDFLKILSWFCDHNPFNLPAKLMCLDSGFIDESNTVDCDRTEEIGAHISESLNNQTFTTCSFKRNNQIKTLQSLYSSISVEQDCVAIDPLTLFLRLIVLVDQKPDTEIGDSFYYELTSYSFLLF